MSKHTSYDWHAIVADLNALLADLESDGLLHRRGASLHLGSLSLRFSQFTGGFQLAFFLDLALEVFLLGKRL